MYYCPDCGCEFETPKKLFESHGLSSRPFEAICVCPDCKGGEFYEKSSTHCRCCGAKLSTSQSDYCSDTCRNKGTKMWKREQKRRHIRNESPINIFITELELYNKENKSMLSYGQYEAIKHQEEQKRKCSKKKRNT